MTIQQLIKFYLACIETEDRQALSKKLSALHHSVISPWDNEEMLFSRDATSVEFETSNDTELKLLVRGAAIAGDPERFYYGYPLYLFMDRGDWFISPLFMQEVEVEQQDRNRYVVQVKDSEGLEVNLHLFQKQHVPPEELQSVARDLEGDFTSLDARIESAFQAMSAPCPGFLPGKLDPWPTGPLTDGSWLNRPILFKSERSGFTLHLKRELEILGQDPALNIRAAGTALGTFFAAKLPEAFAGASPVPLVPVLPMNKGQEDAARSALNEPLTVVTGPPGTGKSQVVVNLLASCALAGRPALFASKNNKAVDVVRQRLRALLGDQQDWILRLGNKEMMEECRQEMDGRLAAAASFALEVPASPEVAHQLDMEIESTRANIEKLAAIQNELFTLDQESRSLESIVQQSWVRACEGWAGDCTWLQSAKQSRQMSEDLASKAKKGFRLWMLRTLFRKRTLGRLNENLALMIIDLPAEIRSGLSEVLVDEPDGFGPIVREFQMLCALGGWRQAVAKYERKVKSLAAMAPAQSLVVKLESLQAQRSELAAVQFRVGWTRRIKTSPTHQRLSRYFDLVGRASRLYGGNGQARIIAEWAQQVAILGSDLPIWIVTNLSARRALPLSPCLFDLIIIDEASQCDIPSALPLLYRARRAIIIGDPHQLRHISTLRTSDEMDLASQFGMEDSISRWSYNQRSLYNLAEEVIANVGKPIGFLAEHYRSHPEIVEFSNRSFYSGRLVVRTKIDALKEKTGSQPLGVFWHDTPGTVPQSSKSAWNEAEAKGVLELLDHWHSSGFLMNSQLTFGIVTPFRLQMEKLRERIGKMPWYKDISNRLTVGTAHRFQGDECDVMIFSPVVAKGMLPRLVHWVAETDQLLNVAITRARAALHVVGDMQANFEAGGKLGDFAAFVQAGIQTTSAIQETESPAEQAVADMLRELGIWHKCQYDIRRYRLDFLVVSPLGIRYDLEVDGRGHLADEALRADEIRDAFVQREGLKVMRIDARNVFNRGESVKMILARIC